MSEPKWTPGPWTLFLDSCAQCEKEGSAEYVISGPPGGYHGQFSNETDAHLIAAAPTMYEALEFVFDHIADKERGPRDLYPAFGLDAGRAVEMVRAALAKARGEP